MTALKPCPFCGGEATTSPAGDWHWCLCLNSECTFRPAGHSDTPEAAARLWNTRPTEDALVAALEELHAIVWGECPALLNEDSGGSGGLDIQIRTLIAQHRRQG